MLNGEGLRTVLWVSGCTHQCKNCHNPITWDITGGIEFDTEAENELFEALSKKHVDGLTFSGGDPLHPMNREEVSRLIKKARQIAPDKTIWLYTGYSYEDIKDVENINLLDVLIDGEFVEELKDERLHWVGSSNQRIIDVKKTIEKNEIVLYDDNLHIKLQQNFEYNYKAAGGCNC